MNVTLRRGRWLARLPRLSRGRRTAVAAAVLLAAPGLASCGFDPATNALYQPGEGSIERSSDVDILNAIVVSAEDGSGTLVAGLVNQDIQRPDALVDISGAGESSDLDVQLADAPVDLPSNELVELVDMADIVIRGDAVAPGYIIQLRFTFQRAEPVTMYVPVHTRTGPYATIPVPSQSSPAASPSGSPAPSGSPTPSASPVPEPTTAAPETTPPE